MNIEMRARGKRRAASDRSKAGISRVVALLGAIPGAQLLAKLHSARARNL